MLAKTIETKAKQIDDNLRLFDGITSALYAPNSNGIIGDTVRAASPQLAYQIGQEFKRKDQEGSAQHLLAHAVLGAAVSYATGNNITTGALSGAGSEVAAPALANYLYGTNEPSELNQEQKDTIVSILNLATVTTAYTATDGNTTDAMSAAEVGKIGVENNNYTWTAESFGMTTSDINHAIAKMERCQANPSASDCQPRNDYLGDYARNVVNNATSGINTTTSVEASGVALFGFAQSRGIATDIKGNACTVDATCFLLGPRVGGSAGFNQELATGNLTPGEKYYGVSIDGAVVPIAGVKGNVSLYSNGSVGYHGGASSGADFGLAVKVCSV